MVMPLDKRHVFCVVALLCKLLMLIKLVCQLRVKHHRVASFTIWNEVVFRAIASGTHVRVPDESVPHMILRLRRGAALRSSLRGSG